MFTCDFPTIKKLRSGKVREVFDLGRTLLLVTTDRLSAFDVILPDIIPNKGRVLNQLSAFWFQKLNHLVPNHLLSTEVKTYPQELKSYASLLEGRSMIVKKTEPLPVECVVRGYLAGNGWKEYQQQGTLAGVSLPKGLREAEQLPEVFFTPSTKAEQGHDEPMSWQQCQQLLGNEMAEQVRKLSIALYETGRHEAAAHGIIIADTKFEFGLYEGKIILIDECMTPDSSRFWPMDSYQVGKNPPSFDKQYVRDFLENIHWNKMPPAPKLPPEVIRKTAEKYQEALERLTG